MAAPDARQNRRQDDPQDTPAPGVTRGRREEDAATGGTTQAEGSRRQDFFRRFRQPLIGLGLAGMALPMVQATTRKPAEPAMAMPYLSRISSASISARGITGTRRLCASSSSGLSGFTADENTTTSASATRRHRRGARRPRGRASSRA